MIGYVLFTRVQTEASEQREQHSRCKSGRHRTAFTSNCLPQESAIHLYIFKIVFVCMVVINYKIRLQFFTPKAKTEKLTKRKVSAKFTFNYPSPRGLFYSLLANFATQSTSFIFFNWQILRREASRKKKAFFSLSSALRLLALCIANFPIKNK